MKKKKGFTLIELLAVIVILAIIALIAVPVIMNIITQAKKSAFKDTAYGIINAGELYYANKALNINGMTEDVTINLPDTNNVLDLKGEMPNGMVKINKDGNVALAVTNGKYCITKHYDDTDISIRDDIENCDILSYPFFELTTVSSQLGVIKIDECAKDGICDVGTAFAIKVNDTETYKFHVISDNGNKITLIMSENLGASAWINSSDYGSGYSWHPPGSPDGYVISFPAAVYKGPLTALNDLNVLTSDWINIPIQEYTYSSVNYSSLTKTMRVKMPSNSNIAILRAENGLNLPDYLSDDFWLSDNKIATSSSPATSALISSSGTNSVSGSSGLRPIITLFKQVNESASNTDYTDANLNGADPVLKTGMIPVVISADGTVTKADKSNEWYNYANKEWANAVLVTDNTRSTYESLGAGETIAESDILAYFVWIPRYRYALWHTETAGTSTSLDVNKIHSISIVFENKTTTKSDGTCNGTYEKPTDGCYLTHPAFTFGEEVNGIWVGKFETGYSGATSATKAQIEALDSSKVIIKPTTTNTKVYSWINNTIHNMFYTALRMNYDPALFGLTTDSDTHMMKNTEWGAVTYLAFSAFGKDSEVYLNNNSQNLTGCGADAVDAYPNGSCLNMYGTKSNDVYNQSTTGNISGIFDMSGGVPELVMGYTTAAKTQYGSSGFTSATFPNAKYIDIYSSTNANQYSNRILGDATGEMGPFAQDTSSWYDDYSGFVGEYFPWFVRSNIAGNATGSGLAAFNSNAGDRYSSFRIVLTDNTSN